MDHFTGIGRNLKPNELSDSRAQVRLIDFCITAVVESSKIRKFHDNFSYNQLSFIGKIRSECSLELLNQQLFQPFDSVNASLIRPAGNGFEIFLDRDYFIDDDNFEEENLQIEDQQLLLQQAQWQLQQNQQQQQQNQQ